MFKVSLGIIYKRQETDAIFINGLGKLIYLKRIKKGRLC